MNYRIKHDGVGPFQKGRIVSDKQFAEIPGVDVDRLLNVGAIEVSDEKSVTQTKLVPGPENPGKPPKPGKPKAATDTEAPAEDETPADDEEEGAGAEVEAVDYSAKTKAELLRLAGEREIDVSDSMKKDEIIEALEAKDKEDAAAAE